MSNFIRNIDIYAEPISWYIGKDNVYKTLSGGIRTIIVISISLLFLIYSLIKLFTDRAGSFALYDLNYLEINDTDFVYFEDIEIFLEVNYRVDYYNINTSLFQSSLLQYSFFNQSIIKQYLLEECDKNYFFEQLGTTQTNILSDNSYIFCLNKNKYQNKETKIKLSKYSLNKINYYFLLFLNDFCDEECTEEERELIDENLNNLAGIYVYIRYKSINPLQRKNPYHYEVINLFLDDNYPYGEVFLKNYNMTTQSSIIPYLFEKEKDHFLTYDYHQLEWYQSEIYSFSNHYLQFYLSSKNTFLDREYEQLDSVLASFLGIFEALQAIGKILTIFIDSFSKESYIFNFIAINKLFKKSNRILIPNPPKKEKPKSNSFSNFKYKENELFNKNETPESKRINIETSFLKNSQKSISKDEIIICENNDENKYEKEKKIKLNPIKSIWCNTLKTFDIENSKFSDVKNSLDKIELIKRIFNVSVYVNLFFDMMKLKKILFNNQQLKLFESIYLTIDEINDDYEKISSEKDINSEKVIKKIIEETETKNNNEIIEQLIGLLKKQNNV